MYLLDVRRNFNASLCQEIKIDETGTHRDLWEFHFFLVRDLEKNDCINNYDIRFFCVPWADKKKRLDR